MGYREWPHYGDELNLVEPGFNSGWVKVQGIWTSKLDSLGEISIETEGLIDFNGKGKPEFTWILPVAPTALKFFSSTAYGPEYENDLFVADANTGRIYHFELNENRTGLHLPSLLADRVVDNMQEMKEITFAKGFGRITDMQLGPDGNLYILSSGDKAAHIDRIVSTNSH